MPTKQLRPGAEHDDRLNWFERDEPPGTTVRRGRGNEPLHENQKRLSVNREHKTEIMRRRRRGTFP